MNINLRRKRENICRLTFKRYQQNNWKCFMMASLEVAPSTLDLILKPLISIINNRDNRDQ